MKKIFFIIGSVVSCSTAFSQEPADALRFSWTIPSGTARQQAIGGAMTSLGGDITAAHINPAGLGFYKTGDVVITPGFAWINNKSSYFDNTENQKKSKGTFGTIGVVWGEATGKDGSGHAIALSLNQMASFGNNITYRGINTQSSYSQKFLEEIKNNEDSDPNSVASNYPFGTSLAFNTYWIDTIAGGAPGAFNFQTRAPFASGLIQENIINNHGGITELALAFAGNKKDKFLYGVTLGIPLLDYSRNSTFSEADRTTVTTNKFDFATIEENLETSGVGVNLKAGIIYKPKEYIRLGLAIHSPTFFMLTDKYNATVTTNTESYKGELYQSSSEFTEGQDAETKYTLMTPYRVMISASYVIREIEDVRKQKGFITADIEYVNHKASSFSPDTETDDSESTKTYLKSLNKAIDNSYKGAFNFKVGGELKFTTIMARLGLAYFSNPYKPLAGPVMLGSSQQKGSRFQLSGGLGYRNKGMFIDATYVRTMSKDFHVPYRLQNTPFNAATIKSTGGNIILTVGFKI